MSNLKSWNYNSAVFDNGGKRKKIIISCVIPLVIAIVVFVICFSSCHSSKDKDNAKKVDNTSSVNLTEKSDNGEGAIDPENSDAITDDIGASVNSENLTVQTGKANGIDVSKWQGKINWQSVKSSGIDFAIIRIGFRGENGTIYKDDYADYNIQQAQKSGVLVGVYFFSTAVSETEAKEEAMWTASAIEGYSISYPVVYDCEGFNSSGSRMYGISKSKRTDIALAFLNSVKKSGYDGMLYSSKNELENSKSWDTSRIEKQFKIWVAQYPKTTYPEKKSPDYSGKYGMWQYTNMGRVSGVNGNTDLIVSYFIKSKAEPKNPSAKVNDVSAPTENSNIYKTVNETVTAKELTNLRDAASTKSNIVATIKNGEFVTRIGTGSNGWSKLEYNGKVVYAITSYLTTDNNYTVTTTKSNVVNGQTFSNVSEKVTAKNETNLRSGPSTNSDVVATIKNGDIVTRNGVGDKGWSRILYNGQTVYAVSNYITTDLNVTTSAPQGTTANNSGVKFTDVNEGVTAKEETNLRSTPSSKDDSNIVVRLKKGEYVTRTGVSNNGWSRLVYNGQTVYAVSSLLTN